MRGVLHGWPAVVVLLLVVSRTVAESPSAGEGFSIGSGEEQAAIAIKPSSPLVTRTAKRLADYLELRTGNRPEVLQAPPPEGEVPRRLCGQAEQRPIDVRLAFRRQF